MSVDIDGDEFYGLDIIVIGGFGDGGGDGEEEFTGGIWSEADHSKSLVAGIQREFAEDFAGGEIDGHDGVVFDGAGVEFFLVGRKDEVLRDVGIQDDGVDYFFLDGVEDEDLVRPTGEVDQLRSIGSARGRGD